MSLGIKWPTTVCRERTLSGEICPLFTYSICVWKCTDIFRGWIFSLESCSIERIFRGEINFQGKFYTGGIWQNSYTKFWLSSILFADWISYVDIIRRIIWGVFSVFWFLGEKISTEGVFLDWPRKQLKINVFFKWKCTNVNFSGWIVHKKFHGIFSKDEIVWREFVEGEGVYFTEDFPLREREIFHRR